MKRNLFAFCAIVMAVIFSSFTIKPLVTSYFIYNGSGDQDDILNYAAPETTKPAIDPGSTSLNWLRVDDNDGIVDQTEFKTGFEALDQVNTTSDVLDDDMEDSDFLDKK